MQAERDTERDRERRAQGEKREETRRVRVRCGQGAAKCALKSVPECVQSYPAIKKPHHKKNETGLLGENRSLLPLSGIRDQQRRPILLRN